MRKKYPTLAELLRSLASRVEDGVDGDLEVEMMGTVVHWNDLLDAARRARVPARAAAAHRAAEPARVAATHGIRIWCDGSCAPNPGPGGWGAIVEADGQRTELSGASPASTNNIMEMTAAIEALQHTAPGAEVAVTTDSEYLKNGITQWIHAWKRKGWRTSTGGAVKNQNLWRVLDELVSQRTVRWHWVRGHSGHAENERCDELANAARRSLG